MKIFDDLPAYNSPEPVQFDGPPPPRHLWTMRLVTFPPDTLLRCAGRFAERFPTLTQFGAECLARWVSHLRFVHEFSHLPCAALELPWIAGGDLCRLRVITQAEGNDVWFEVWVIEGNDLRMGLISNSVPKLDGNLIFCGKTPCLKRDRVAVAA